MSDQAVEVYSDGACKGNPGPGGWGFLLKNNGREEERFGGEALTTNNRMEMTAVIRALESLQGRQRVRVYTDSQYVQKGMSEWIKGWKRRGWRTADKSPVKNEDLWRRLDELSTTHDVSWHWVRGHDGHPENERADLLANQGIPANG
jgi:ribonuclease HI